ncbi:methyltransferase domain protein [Burkholderia pseudomallei MSHR3965]|nr:methyltransferase domain protein [Burkholderia pseudomallei MSHR3965]KGS98204.1 methyltransferase domain protein [Burkholderia pseudomallei]KGV15589.1 methyltransferase domain protein [Burkholderia pseudomallei MSHR4300]KGW12058.1 methyltransferase domain protein [Burkholderia pseudomallei MSHR4000]
MEPEPDEDDSARYRLDQSGPAWQCPSCQSLRTEQRHIARRICSAVGAAAGATSGTAAALSGVETGAAIGALGGPAGALCGGIAGAILAGLVADAAGCATGAAFGEALDQTIFDNMLCLACGAYSLVSDTRQARRSEAEHDYFHLRWFKNGNGHLTFKRPDW